MKVDIINRQNIEQLIDAFYNKVRPDAQIGYLFSHISDWSKHLTAMYDFWENVVFFSGSYSGNPMESHKALHKWKPMKIEHFQRWVKLFTETVDELFEGENAELIKQRAISIATVMQIKIFQ